MPTKQPPSPPPQPRGSRRPFLAAIVGLAVVITCGIGYRALAEHYAQIKISVPIPKGTLEQLPLTLGDWVGADAPLDEWVIRATDTDDHLSRTYHNTATNENVAIFVGYGGRYRDLTPHQPEVCFVGSGWVMQGIKRYDLPLDSGATLPCRVLSFTKTGFTDERVAVADFYIIDGSFAPDVTKLRAQGLRLKPTANYAAQVQITHEPRRMNEEGSAPVRAFAAIVAPRLRDLLETAVAASKHKQGATTP